ncbi:Vitamin B12 ABC transporter, B12-binding component BtuF [hydrothermal vent metagenome]|uniref:Vitamin B12 ABC transporter, B12-binding component BtuF n=1 Tax=hydrothermal vent metagenome TaxID=652676 RepID=A0A1W1EJ53_9ZZZZ
MIFKLYLLILISTISISANSRIVALSPVINEIIYALQRDDLIVGNTEYSKYPKASKDKYKVGGFFDVSLEKILYTKPSLVIMQPNNIKLSKRLKLFGIKSQIIKINSLQDIKESILKIGQIVDNSIKAKEIVKNIDKALDSIKNIKKDKKILIVIGEYKNLIKGIFVVGKNLYLNDIIISSGNQNAFKSSRVGQPILNLESIIFSNPDIIIILAHNHKLTLSQIKAPWQKLPINASKNNNIFIIEEEYAGIPSDRLVLFLRDFKNILKKSR